MDFEPLLLFSQGPRCSELEVPGNYIFYQQIDLRLVIQKRPIGAEIRSLKRALVIKIEQAHYGIEDIANQHDGTNAERLHQVNVRVRGATMLLRNGIKMCGLSKRGQVDLVFTLSCGVHREQVAVTCQIQEQVL